MFCHGFLAVAAGEHRIKAVGYRDEYMLATRLVTEFVEAADGKHLTKTIACYGHVGLLCIDELGCTELDRRDAELLFQVLTEREEKNCAAIASDESLSGRTTPFTDSGLRAAIVDRLTCAAASSRPAPTPIDTPPAAATLNSSLWADVDAGSTADKSLGRVQR